MKPHKEKAVDFLQLIVSGKIDEAYKKYVSSDFRHHNLYFPGNADSLKQAMIENDGMSPNKTLEVKPTIEEGKNVMVYSHIKQKVEDLGAAVVHIFRFHKGKIVEMWDVGQPVPEDSPNENGMF
jgi:predicted SnoaL-like aldol condensation-catalyzing enzyme